MHDRLLELMALDRLIELIDTDRLRALVERQLPVIELLEALGAKGDVDPSAVRALLAALPASAERGAPRPVAAPTSYLHAIAALRGAPVDGQPDIGPILATQQIYVGPNTLTKDGKTVGYVYVGVIDPTAPTPVHRERFTFADRDAWLKGEAAIRNDGKWPDGGDSNVYARDRRNKDLVDKASTLTYMATLDFTYDGLPPKDKAVGIEPPAGAERRAFKVDVSGLGKDKGRLLRDVFVLGRAQIVVDHWVLASDYKPVQEGVTIGFSPMSGTPPSLEAFIAEAHALGFKWYVQTVYQVLPV